MGDVQQKLGHWDLWQDGGAVLGLAGSLSPTDGSLTEGAGMCAQQDPFPTISQSATHGLLSNCYALGTVVSGKWGCCPES